MQARVDGVLALVIPTHPPANGDIPRCAVVGCYRSPITIVNIQVDRQPATRTRPPIRGGRAALTGLCASHTNALIPGAIKGREFE